MSDYRVEQYQKIVNGFYAVGPEFPTERHAKDFAEAMSEARKRREQRGEW